MARAEDSQYTEGVGRSLSHAADRAMCPAGKLQCDRGRSICDELLVARSSTGIQSGGVDDQHQAGALDLIDYSRGFERDAFAQFGNL